MGETGMTVKQATRGAPPVNGTLPGGRQVYQLMAS